MYKIQYYHDYYNEIGEYKKYEIYAENAQKVTAQLVRINRDYRAEHLIILDLNQPLENRGAGNFRQMSVFDFMNSSNSYLFRRN